MTHFKSYVIFKNEQMKEQESLLSGGWLPRGEGGVNSDKYSSWNMDEGASTLGVEKCWPPAFSLDKDIPPVNRITHISQNITLPQTLFADIKNGLFWMLNSSF